MDNQPSVNRELLIPIFVGALSVIGIVVVLLIGRAQSAPAQVALTPSHTPFQFIFLGTEPAASTTLPEGAPGAPEFEETAGISPPFAETSIFVSPDLPSPLVTPTGFSSVSTPLILGTPNVTTTSPSGGVPTNTLLPTPSSASGPPLNAGTYDDVHPDILKNGWVPSNTGGTTLHVSSTPGSTITFRFIGTELRLFYQGGNTLGQVRVMIDNVAENFDQASGNEWISDTFPNGTHNVLITHVGGGAVNLDYVIVPSVVGTVTPSPTPTVTPTQ